MKATRSLGIVNCYLALSVGVCLVAGCVSQDVRKSRAMTEEGQTVKAGQKAGKTIISADQVPDAVKQAFQIKFPTVKPAEWKIKPDRIYEAEFTLTGTEITVMFDSTGKWLETESAIDPAQVPQVVRAAVARRFRGYKVVETQSVERWNAPDLAYELHLENAREIAKVQFSGEGAILSQSSKAKP